MTGIRLGKDGHHPRQRRGKAPGKGLVQRRTQGIHEILAQRYLIAGSRLQRLIGHELVEGRVDPAAAAGNRRRELEGIEHRRAKFIHR